MDHIDTSWIENLQAVGRPIRNAASYIQAAVEDANRELREAMERHTARIDAAKLEAERLEQSVSNFWTPEEIEAAKAGKMLAL